MSPTGESVEPDRCPSCDSEDVRTIVYGLVEDPTAFAGQRVAFGGCCVGPNDPAWRCGSCAAEWGRRPIEDEDWLEMEEPEEGSFSAIFLRRGDGR